MKEINPKAKENVKIVNQKQIEKGLKFDGSTRIKPGHTLYEWNFAQDELKEADIEEILHMTGKPTYHLFGGPVELKNEPWSERKVVRKPDCIYISALNRKNALKKIRKSGLTTYIEQ